MSKTNNDFKQNFDELEEIVDWFESDDIELDQALEKFERGLMLVDKLKKQLYEAENKVTRLKEKYEIADDEPREDTDS